MSLQVVTLIVSAVSAAAALGAGAVSALALSINRRRINLWAAWVSQLDELHVFVSNSGIHRATVAEVGVMYRPRRDYVPFMLAATLTSYGHFEAQALESGDVLLIAIPAGHVRGMVGVVAKGRNRRTRRVRFYVRTSNGFKTIRLRRWISRHAWEACGLKVPRVGAPRATPGVTED